MISHLLVLSFLGSISGLQNTSYPETGGAPDCIKFDVTTENTEIIAIENNAKIIRLIPEAADRLQKITADNIGRNLCIYSEYKLLVEVTIKAEIDSGIIVTQPLE